MAPDQPEISKDTILLAMINATGASKEPTECLDTKNMEANYQALSSESYRFFHCEPFESWVFSRIRSKPGSEPNMALLSTFERLKRANVREEQLQDFKNDWGASDATSLSEEAACERLNIEYEKALGKQIDYYAVYDMVDKIDVEDAAGRLYDFDGQILEEALENTSEENCEMLDEYIANNKAVVMAGCVLFAETETFRAEHPDLVSAAQDWACAHAEERRKSCNEGIKILVAEIESDPNALQKLGQDKVDKLCDLYAQAKTNPRISLWEAACIETLERVSRNQT